LTEGFCVTAFPAACGGAPSGVGGDGAGVALEELGAGGAGAAHDSDTDATGRFIGNGSDDNGVPGGTSTVNDNCRPPRTVTVTVHCCADAGGNQVRAMPAASTPAVATNRIRFPFRGGLA
jgi:hypothetical protein